MRRDSKKLTPQGQRALIRDYNIQFEGPTRPHQWPEKYAPVFRIVRDAERIRFDDYYQADLEEDNLRTLHVWRMRNRVENLVSQAYRLRESQDNEETWRMKTEHLILERFEADQNCHVCAKRRWLSDLQVMPPCHLITGELRQGQLVQDLCRCDEIVRARSMNERSSQRSFATKVSCTVVDRTMQEIRDRKIARHKPDRVIGLRRAGTLDTLLGENPDTTATVVKGDIDMCFPFLVLEAKSEKNNVGFGSIERQTAFPIRTMLNVQRNLETVPLASLNPIVWFLANQGDEWRVYGCVPDRSRIRVIDLWHGCILRHDSALQLLLIVDMLCDWARDIFAEQVVSSLRRKAELRTSAVQSKVKSQFSIITKNEHLDRAQIAARGRRGLGTGQSSGLLSSLSARARRRETY